MQYILYFSIIILTGLLTVTLFNWWTSPFLSKAPPPGDTPRVSILVPARNEEGNIEQCLDSLVKQDYPAFEIIVLDDRSNDNTAGKIREMMQEHCRIQFLEGQPLPPGWIGKSWACHQLSRAATGDILIFSDADTRHAREAVKKTVGWMQKLNLGLFSAFPQQITQSWSEKLVIPVIDIFVYGALPLWLTYRSSSELFAAANGQWIAFTRRAYRDIGGHGAVRNKIVEDVEFSRLAKRKGIRILTTAGTGVVFCRMYHNAREVWEGFSKNLFGITGYHTAVLVGIISALFGGAIFPYFLLIFSVSKALPAAVVGMNVLFRGLLAVKYRHPFWSSVLLHPLGVSLTILIGLNSFWKAKTGFVTWKGRKIHISEPRCQSNVSDAS